MRELDPERVAAALERLVAGDIDYDAHKGVKYGEEDGHEDQYPFLADRFMQYYEEATD